MKSSLKRNLLIGFGVSLLVLVGSSVASWVSVHNLLASATLVKHTNEVVQKLQETMSFMKDAETGERGFLVTGKDQYLDPYTGSADKVKILIGDIRQLTADNPDQQQPLQKLEERINRRFWNWQDMIGKKRMTDIVTLSDMQQGKNSMDSIRVVVADMIAREQTILQTRTASRNSFASITPPLIIAGALLAILITVIFYVNMNRDIADRARLQEELIDKDAGISRRIRVIQSISEKISTGDYGVRVTDSET
ncbi:MAG: CHASE3 domain-containing protein, partial [Bacteroidota bacterium]